VRQIRKRLTYANVMSSIAVFLVIGGGAALAAANLPKNSVGSRQLQTNAVKTGKVAAEAIKAGKLAQNAVTTNRLRDNVVTNAKIQDNAVTTNKILDNAVTGAKVDESSLSQVPDAAKLGGNPPSSFQTTSGLLFATVAPAEAGAAVVRGRGATGVTRIATGFYAVSFDRDVSGCTWVATYGQPNNTGVNAVWATVRGFTGNNEVGVVLRNENGAQVDGNGFHLAVLCP
jgi:hypothetical protein